LVVCSVSFLLTDFFIIFLAMMIQMDTRALRMQFKVEEKGGSFLTL
jgi:hypothetical protein